MISPDPVLLEVIWQGENKPCRLRLTLPDGTRPEGELDPQGLASQIEALRAEWRSGRPETSGKILYNALFPGSLSAHFTGALRASGSRGLRFRLLLDKNLPALQRIPWERLYYPFGDQWLPAAVSPSIQFSRQLDSNNPWGLPRPAGKIRVLVVISCPFNPGNPWYFDPALEEQAVAAVFETMRDQVEWTVHSGFVNEVQIADWLNQGGGYDVLHYVGHGEWNESEQTSFLILSETDPAGALTPSRVPADRLAAILRSSNPMPQLIFLGACESAQQSTLDAFTGVGPQLVQVGCPAVVCMQEKVENAIARQFARGFYGALLESGTVDYAVNRGRIGLLDNPYFQWAVPVVFMRLVDGILFNPSSRVTPGRRRPFKSLLPYQVEDQDLFKGRQTKINEVLRQVEDNPVTVVYGEPGVGLTSLLEAGLRPKLEEKGWLVTRLSDYGDLAGEFRERLRLNGRPVSLPLAGDAPLAEVLRAVEPAAHRTLVLALDQFERLCSQPEDHHLAVTRLLEDSLQALGTRLKIILLLHQDSLAGLNDFRSLIETRAGAWIKLPPLNKQEAVEAIFEPLAIPDSQVFIKREFADQVIATDLGSLYGGDKAAEDTVWIDPGHLQITCTWLYDQALQLKPPIIDEELYLKKAGGADGILVRYMEEELQTRFAGQSDLARSILVAMAAPDMERWVLPSQILASSIFTSLTENSGPLSGADITPLLDQLVKAELLGRRSVNAQYRYGFSSRLIADEAVRLGSERIQNAYNAGDELERIWRLWLAGLAKARPGSKTTDRYLATREQYLLLSELGKKLVARPVKLLLLLRSAVLHNEDPSPWMDRLRAKEEKFGLISALETSGAAAPEADLTPSARELAGRLLGINDPDLPPQPSQEGGYSRLAWTAAGSSDTVDRRTSALALSMKYSEAGKLLTELDLALNAIKKPVTRFARRSEIFGTLADAGIVKDEMRSRSAGQRLGVYLWRVWMRVLHDRRWITWMALGCAIGAGLGLGLERLLVGALSASSMVAGAGLGRIYFALFSYWGLILGGLTGLLIALAGPLQLKLKHKEPDPSPNGRLAIVLGILGFGLANLLVAVLNNINLARAGLMIPAGFVAGIGLSVALAVPARKPTGLMLRVLLGAVFFTLTQAFFLFLPQFGSGISIAFSSGIIQVEFDHFQASWWQNWINSFPGWFDLLALLEAGLSGLALTGGAVIGLKVASGWYQRWGAYLDRIGR